jgi:hypothetical protein
VRLSKAWYVAGAIVVAGVVLGLVPFTLDSGETPRLRSHCRGALIEAWPERRVDGGWFNYAPNSGLVLTSGQYSVVACGAEARRRVVVPLMVSTVVFGAACAVMLRRSHLRAGEDT